MNKNKLKIGILIGVLACFVLVGPLFLNEDKFKTILPSFYKDYKEANISLEFENDYEEDFEEIEEEEETEVKDKKDISNLFTSYKDLLEDFYYNPEDYYFVPQDRTISSEDNNFVIMDLNEDGIEELLIKIVDTYAYDQKTLIYTKNEKGTVEELATVGANNVYYSDGWIKSDANHNQTYGKLWPYILYKYNKETKEYEPIYNVRSAAEELDTYYYDYDPEYDLDGDGVVYIIENLKNDTYNIYDYEGFSGFMDNELNYDKLIKYIANDISIENIEAVTN